MIRGWLVGELLSIRMRRGRIGEGIICMWLRLADWNT